MEWLTVEELGKAFGLALGGGFSVGAMIALFNSWKA